MKKRIISIIVAAFLVAGGVSLATAAEIEGHYYPDDVSASTANLKITGVALFRYWGFKAFTVAFYIEAGAPAEEVLADRAKKLELAYFRSIKGEDFGKAVNSKLAKHLDPETFGLLKQKIDYHNGLYQDIEPGDRDVDRQKRA